jgi:predicted kinase
MTSPTSLVHPELPQDGLLVIVGASGAGKSTVAAAWPADQVLCLDALRGAISDPGDQDATADAVTVFTALLNARLARRRQTVIDATNTFAKDRAFLLQHARAHGVPAVAITVRTPLATCLARQAGRPTSRQVPKTAVIQQHASLPTSEQLLAEGFTQVHDAADLDLLHAALERTVNTAPDPLADIRTTFGPTLAAMFTYDDEHPARGRFAAAGREIQVRDVQAEPYDHPWQARVPDETCECGGGLWVTVTGPTDLLDVYSGGCLPEEPVCDRCDETA